ncbi:hypothetical protein PRJBM_01290 [Bartonella henselae]|nr:hypothetical protein PRJBM_01290 [Bartonella henselae]CUH91218.1 hypothetical protein BM1374164_01290 [Bartonella henselae]
MMIPAYHLHKRKEGDAQWLLPYPLHKHRRESGLEA